MELDALAHSLQSETVPSKRCGIEAAPVVLDHGGSRAVTTDEEDADAARFCVFDDVGQRLLDDSVERGFNLGRQPLLAKLRLEVDADAAGFGECLHQPF